MFKLRIVSNKILISFIKIQICKSNFWSGRARASLYHSTKFLITNTPLKDSPIIKVIVVFSSSHPHFFFVKDSRLIFIPSKQEEIFQLIFKSLIFYLFNLIKLFVVLVHFPCCILFSRSNSSLYSIIVFRFNVYFHLTVCLFLEILIKSSFLIAFIHQFLLNSFLVFVWKFLIYF